MPAESKMFDFTVGVGSHGLKCCAHTIIGIHLTGSSDTNVNGLATSRALVDFTVHTCPHCSVGMLIGGSSDVNTNGSKDHRIGDAVTEFCGTGVTITGSPDVFDNG